MIGIHRLGRLWALFCAIGLALFAGRGGAEDKPRENGAIKPVERVSTGARQLHEAFLERAKKGKVDVLFLGDGLTQQWTDKGAAVWTTRFDKWNAANFGLDEDRTQHVLWRITTGKELDGIDPKVVILLVGGSNLDANTPDEVAAGVKAIVTELRKQKPKAKVLLLGLLPRLGKEEKDLKNPIVAAQDELHAAPKAVNEKLAALDDGKGVQFLNIGDKFLDASGGLAKATMPDFLHLSQAGYAIWAEAIAKPVEAALSGNP